MKGEQYMKKTLLYSGKAKDIFSTEDEDLIVSVYKDQATMLNGARKETLKAREAWPIKFPL
jgi:phosphoribosylaminoimidazole-succinocarboxamide synthase